MAVRIRKDGSIVCAAMFGEEPGDTYIDDGLHYHLSVEQKVLVAEAHEHHQKTGRWWWAGNVPDEVTIDPFYLGSRLSG